MGNIGMTRALGLQLCPLFPCSTSACLCMELSPSLGFLAVCLPACLPVFGSGFFVLSLAVYLHVYLSLGPSPSLALLLALYLHVCLSLGLSAAFSLSLAVYLPVYLGFGPSPFICLTDGLPTCSALCGSVCPVYF